MEDKEQIPAKPIILLSGPPGAGKSTIANELVQLTPGQVACIEGDKFWYFFAKGWEQTEVAKNFRTLMASITAASIPYARAGYEVIVDFSIPPWFLPTSYRMASARGLALHYVLIRPDKQICAQRAAARSEGAVADYSRFNHLYDSFDGVAFHTISDNECSAADMAARIRDGLDKGLFLVTEENLPKPKKSVSG